MAASIRDQLAGVFPAALLAALDAGPGWQVELAGGALAWDELGPPVRHGDEVRWSLGHAAGLRADVALDRDPARSAARLQVTLVNTSDRESPPLAAIKPVSLRLLGLSRESVQVRAVGGGLTHAYYPPGAYRERAVVLRPGGSEPFRIESGADGRSANRDLPLLQLTAGGRVGAGLVVALEWSGQWHQQVALRPDGLAWEAGIPVRGLTLAPGERLALPTAHLIAFAGDQDAGGNACRRYVYDRISPDLGGRRPLPPISYDHWFGIACDFDEPFLRRLADRAAELGAEYFVLDAGWYAGCGPGGAFSQGVGNWERVDAAKFPAGLERFAEYVRARGLRFGLWFEPERAHRSSDLAREHPDWCLDVGAEYLHLNLALPAAQDYLIRLVGGWIERLGLEWTRWDYNIGPRAYWEQADPTGKLQFAYVAGLYRVLDTLLAAHPGWLLEGCASGGRRIDLGTLRRAHTFWFSDHTEDALVCRFMQLGAARFLPGHLPNSSVPVARGAGDAGLADADVLARLCGALSFDGDVASWSPELTVRVAALVARYREFRHLLVGDFYPLSPQPARPAEPEVAQFASRDGADAVVLGFAGASLAGEVTVRPRALDPRALYDVWDPLGEGAGGERQSGEELLAGGLRLDLTSGAAIRRVRRAAGR